MRSHRLAFDCRGPVANYRFKEPTMYVEAVF
jgi:hypothetical protein